MQTLKLTHIKLIKDETVCCCLFQLFAKKYCVFNVSNVGGVFNNLDKKISSEGGHLINIEVNI